MKFATRFTRKRAERPPAGALSGGPEGAAVEAACGEKISTAGAQSGMLRKPGRSGLQKNLCRQAPFDCAGSLALAC
ncbi:MAG: hypothetical protein GX495_05935 [Chloroflexi bacterium]|nr:hypothetical protein [Chloroflexota bacterium]